MVTEVIVGVGIFTMTVLFYTSGFTDILFSAGPILGVGMCISVSLPLMLYIYMVVNNKIKM